MALGNIDLRFGCIRLLLGLTQFALVFGRVYAGHHLASFDIVSLAQAQLGDFAGYPRLDDHGVDGFEVARDGQVLHQALLGGDHGVAGRDDKHRCHNRRLGSGRRGFLDVLLGSRCTHVPSPAAQHGRRQQRDAAPAFHFEIHLRLLRKKGLLKTGANPAPSGVHGCARMLQD